MRTWKLPRKRKKAYIKTYSRAWYRMMVRLSRAKQPAITLDDAGPVQFLVGMDVGNPTATTVFRQVQVPVGPDRYEVLGGLAERKALQVFVDGPRMETLVFSRAAGKRALLEALKSTR